MSLPFSVCTYVRICELCRIENAEKATVVVFSTTDHYVRAADNKSPFNEHKTFFFVYFCFVL